MTSTPEPPAAAAFARIKIRTGALVFCGDYVALIRRDRSGSTHYTPPGGNVEHGEDLDVALARELAEELDLDIDQAEGGALMWVVDQRVTRPGPTPPPRKLHLPPPHHPRGPRHPRRGRTGRTARRQPRDRCHRVGRLPQDRRTADLPARRGRPRRSAPSPRHRHRRRPRSRHRRQLHLGLINLPDAGPAAAASQVRPSLHAMRQCHRLDSHSVAGRQ
ncbi:NUDIX hydrolase [Streptomyces rubiginosohelvolus]|uniref:NUDIX hydrolase n=1 Tax=Streptomyces rubiginosohelvolus TaxID=67362 RepID=UPI003819ABFD